MERDIRQVVVAGSKNGKPFPLVTYPTGISKDGTVVVGGYADDATGNPSDETTGSTADDGKNISYYNRCFIWTRDSGFHDLWDLAAPKHPMQPTYIGGNYYCAVSPDGTKVVALAVTGKLTLFGLPKGQTAPVEQTQSRFQGTVKSLRTGDMVLLADSVTLPNGQTIALKPAREKRVLLPQGVRLPSGVKAGSKIVVTGADGGRG